MANLFYTDLFYKKSKPKSDVLENQLERTEQELIKCNEIPSLYNVSIPTQDEVWICGRVFSENAGSGGGKLNEHNVSLEGSYVCSNSHSISLNLTNCNQYSLFPGQIILANGRNPDGKKFICKEIVEPSYVSNKLPSIKKEECDQSNRDSGINVKLEPNEELNIMVASGPYMVTGSIQLDPLNALVNAAKAKNVHVLILLGPFIDSNHDLISTGNIQFSYDELMQNILENIAINLAGAKMQVILQPSLNDITQEPIYPVHAFNVPAQFIKQNENFHLLHEPSIIKVNDVPIAITTTDIIKDLTSISVSKSNSSDKISRNFMHMLRQRSFYPIYPPPDHVCIDYEAWLKYAKINLHPKIFIAVSDLITFNKEVNNCVCINPGRLVKGTSNGTYAQLTFQPSKVLDESQANIASCVTVNFQKI